MADVLTLLLGFSLSALAGAVVGAFSGLVPGLHPNSLAVLFSGYPQAVWVFAALANAAQMPSGSSSILIGCFLIGLLMSHSLSEVIPTAKLGIIDDETFVSQLPSQRLFNLGRPDLVIESVMIGGLGAVAIFALLLLPMRLIMGAPIGLYDSLRPFLGLIILALCTYVLLVPFERVRFSHSLFVFLISGTFGIIVLTLQVPVSATNTLFGDFWKVDSSSFLLCAFSGMFAFPSLAFSSNSPGRPPSRFRGGEKLKVNKSAPLLRSIIPSILVGWLPGITNAYAVSSSTRRARQQSIASSFSYLITFSATNVGGSLQSIVAMGTILRYRNGTLEALKDQFDIRDLSWDDPFNPPTSILVFLWAACVSIVLGAWLVRILGEKILFTNRDGCAGKILKVSVAILLISLIVLSTGPVGMLVCLSCFILASIALRFSVPRVHLMGFLLVPVIVYFLS